MPPAVDPQAIAALRELNPEDPSFLRELIDVFVDDMPRRCAELESALASRDAALLGRAAHTIKGSCSNFGAADLAQVALTLEQQAKAAAFGEAATTLPALRRELDVVIAALRQLR